MISTSALRIESDCRRIKPENGLSSSVIITIPQAHRVGQRPHVIAVGLGGANNPKPAKTMASQKISKTKNGFGMLLPARWASDPRAWIRVLDSVKQSIGR